MSVGVPRLRFPLRFTNGRTELVEQDSIEEIAQCVEIILRTPRGQRLDLPDFGIPDQAFRENGADLVALRSAIEQYEPRAAVVLEHDGVIERLVDRVTVTTTSGAR